MKRERDPGEAGEGGGGAAGGEGAAGGKRGGLPPAHNITDKTAGAGVAGAVLAGAGTVADGEGGESAGGVRSILRVANRRPDWELPKRLDGLQLSPDDKMMQEVGKRHPCPKCKRNRAYYCSDCVVPFTELPRLELPVRISVITSSDEARTKSTGVHAALLAPAHVAMHSLQASPPFDPARSLVLFPSEEAVEVEEVAGMDIDRVFVIDSKWSYGLRIAHDPILEGCKHVKLSGTKTAFWRFHTKGVSEEAVCTIEAIYHLCRSLARARDPGGGEQHQYDDLLFLFDFMHRQVEEAIKKRALERSARDVVDSKAPNSRGHHPAFPEPLPGTQKQRRRKKQLAESSS